MRDYLAGYDPPDEFSDQELFRCDCGAYLSKKASGTEEFEDSTKCDGVVKPCEFGWIALCGYCDGKHPPHKVIHNAGTILLFDCKRCGAKGVKRGY